MRPNMDAQKVIEELGGAAKVAKALKSPKRGRKHVTVQALYKWERVPIERCADIAKLSNGKFTPQQLRPDFPWPKAA